MYQLSSIFFFLLEVVVLLKFKRMKLKLAEPFDLLNHYLVQGTGIVYFSFYFYLKIDLIVYNSYWLCFITNTSDLSYDGMTLDNTSSQSYSKRKVSKTQNIELPTKNLENR